MLDFGKRKYLECSIIKLVYSWLKNIQLKKLYKQQSKCSAVQRWSPGRQMQPIHVTGEP